MTAHFAAIEELALSNTFFRLVLFTAPHARVVLMCLQPSEEIGNQVHLHVDRFFRIERGDARVVLNKKDKRLVHDADAVVVPVGTYRNVFNASKTAPLRLSTIYSPPNHPDGTVHKTKAEADAAEKAHA